MTDDDGRMANPSPSRRSSISGVDQLVIEGDDIASRRQRFDRGGVVGIADQNVGNHLGRAVVGAKRQHRQSQIERDRRRRAHTRKLPAPDESNIRSIRAHPASPPVMRRIAAPAMAIVRPNLSFLPDDELQYPRTGAWIRNHYAQ